MQLVGVRSLGPVLAADAGDRRRVEPAQIGGGLRVEPAPGVDRLGPAFLERCISTTDSVAHNADFIRAFRQLSRHGNGLTYLSPRMTRQMHGLLDRVIEANGSSMTTTIARFFLPDIGYPVGWVVTNRHDGILFTSNTPSSHKSTLLTLGYAALLPALAVVGTSMLAPEPSTTQRPFD